MGASSTQVNRIIASAPDLLFIHFGINDCGSGISANMFADNIESLILNVKAALPECGFVFINPVSPNPNAYDSDKLAAYWKK